MRIDHPERSQIPALRALWKEAFGDSDTYLDLFFDRGYDPDRAMCVSDGETVAAALYWLDMDYSGGKLPIFTPLPRQDPTGDRGFAEN